MPLYDAELDDGRVVTLESDHEPTHDEVLAALNRHEEKPKVGALETAAEHAATGVIPTAAFAKTFGAVAPIATGIASETGPFAPIIGGAAGLIAGGGAAMAAGWGQRKLLKAAAPKFTERIEAGAEQHPVAAFTGSLASGLPSFRLAPIPGELTAGKTLATLAKQRAIAAGAGAAVSEAQSLITEQKPAPLRDVAEGAAFTALYGGPRKWLLPRAAVAAGKGSYASKDKTTAAVHGDVRAQPIEVESEVSPAEGSAGVQPQATPVAKAAQVPLTQTQRLQQSLADAQQMLAEAELPADKQVINARIDRLKKALAQAGQPELAAKPVTELSPVDQKYLDEERKAIDAPVKVVPGLPVVDPNVPFAGRRRKPGEIMSVNRETGEIEVYPEEFSKWLNEDVPEHLRSRAVRSRLQEEQFHLLTDDNAAQTYWGTLTPWEQQLEMRIYGGKAGSQSRINYGKSPILWGHEALRRRMQLASGLDASEFVEGTLKERWSVKGLHVLETAIRGIRERLGTKASKEGLALLDNALKNIGVAKGVMSGQPPPSAQRRLNEEEKASAQKAIRIWKENIAQMENSVSVIKQQINSGRKDMYVEGDMLAEDVLGDLMERRDRLKRRLYEVQSSLDISGGEQTSAPAAQRKRTPEEEVAAAHEMYLKVKDDPFWKSMPQEEAMRRQILIQKWQNYFESQKPEEPSAQRKDYKVDDPAVIQGDNDYRTSVPYDLGELVYRDFKGNMSAEPSHIDMKEMLKRLAFTHDKNWPLSPWLKTQFKKWWESVPEDSPDSRLSMLRAELDYVNWVLENNTKPANDVGLRAWLGSKEYLESMIRQVKGGEFGGPSAQRKAPSDDELASKLGITVQQLRERRERQQKAMTQPSVSAPAPTAPAAPPKQWTPETIAEHNKKVEAQIANLPRGISSKGGPGTVQATTAEQAGARPGLTSMDLQYEAARHLQGEKVPSFEEFADWAKRNVPGTEPNQLVEMWQDAKYRALIGASKARLEQLRHNLDLEGVVGTSEIAEPSGIVPEPEEAAVAGKAKVLESTAKMEAKAADYDRLADRLKTRSRTGSPMENMDLDAQEAGARAAAKALRDKALKLSQETRAASVQASPKAKTKSIEQAEAAKSYRISVISAIARALDPKPPDVDLARETIGIDDIDFSNKRTVEGAWRDINAQEAKDPKVLTRILKDHARRSDKDPVSVTKRLAVLLNPKTGTVDVVSAYPGPNEHPTIPHLKEMMLTDPDFGVGKQRPNARLSTILARKYRTIGSLLLKDPVQNFHQRFETVEDFMDAIGKEAQEAERVRQWSEFAGEQLTETAPVEKPTPEEPYESRAQELEADLRTVAGFLPAAKKYGISPERIEELMRLHTGEESPESAVRRGEGGYLTGPHAGAVKPSTGELVRAERVPISTGEVSAVRDYLQEEVGKIDSPEDMKAALEGLSERYKAGPGIERIPAIETEKPIMLGVGGVKTADIEATQRTPALRGIHRQVISAIKKAADQFQDANPDLTPDQAYEKALDSFYDLITKTSSKEEYIQRALGQFTPKAETVGGQPTPVTRPTGLPSAPRELTMRERVPPTVVRRSFAEPGPPITERRMPPERPEGTTVPREPAKLTPEEEAHVKTVGRLGRYGLQEEPVMGIERPIRPSPSAQRKSLKEHKEQMEATAKKIADEVTAAAVGVKAEYSRKDAKAKIFALKDGADDLSEMQVGEAINSMKLASMKPGKSTAEQKQAAREVREDLLAILPTRFQPDPVKHPDLWVVNPNVFDQSYTSGGKKHKGLIGKALSGIAKAEIWMESKNPYMRSMGKRWKEEAQKLIDIARRAKERYKDPEHKAYVDTYDVENRKYLNILEENGRSVEERKNWIPGIREAAIFADPRIGFGESRLLGTQYRLGKQFDNVYDAIEKGPYWLASNDTAELFQHSWNYGRRSVNNSLFEESVKHMKDAATGKPIAIEPEGTPTMKEVVDPETGEVHEKHGWSWSVPRGKAFLKDPTTGKKIPGSGPKTYLEYEKINVPGRDKPMVVLSTYAKEFKTAVAKSEFKTASGLVGQTLNSALVLGEMLKHGLVLVADTFHPFRLAQMGLANSWRGARFDEGLSGLTYRVEDLDAAVARGQITKQHADWAREKINVAPEGRPPALMSRHGLFSDWAKHGFNVMRLSDTLYRDAVQKLPFIGESFHKHFLKPVNKIIFDRISPGLMAQYGMTNFERMRKQFPNVPYDELRTRLIKDSNAYFGNMGRQGIWKNPTYRDMARVFLLAPLWQEGILQKELRFWTRAGIEGPRYLAGTIASAIGKAEWGKQQRDLARLNFGPIGRALTRGLAAYFVATQVANLITRGKFTWQNDEKGHKMDAWIPTPWSGGESGVWLNPGSVFAEFTHDVLRLMETKKDFWETLNQIGSNKLSPVGRLMRVMASGKNAEGQQIVEGSRLREAAGELVPPPISLAPGIREIGSRVGLMRANRPGEQIQRMLGSVGVKVQTGQTSDAQMFGLARDFVEKNKLKHTTGWQQVQTDEPSYSKLRSALRSDDKHAANRMLTKLRESHTDEQIVKAMTTIRPYTGSWDSEDLFIQNMTDVERDLYQKSIQDRVKLFQKFIQLYLNTQ